MSNNPLPEPERQPDFLGLAHPPMRPSGGGRSRRLAVVGVALGALLVTASGVAVAAALGGGGGPQPEDVMPADAVAFADLDLSPKASQKAAVFRLSRKFPALEGSVTSSDSLKSDLVKKVLEGEPDFSAADVDAWLGDRIGVAAVVRDGEPRPLAAFAYTDADKARNFWQRVATDDGVTTFALSERADYVLVGESQALVDAAAKTDKVLSDSDRFNEAMKALEGDQIATAWADLDAVWTALPDEAREGARSALSLPSNEQFRGRIVLGAHADRRFVEITGRTFDLSVGATSGFGGDGALELASALPADTVAAFAVTGLGEQVGELLQTVAGAGGVDLSEVEQSTGLQFPDDIKTLLGDETLVAALADEQFGARARSDDPKGSQRVADQLLDQLVGPTDGPQLRDTEDGVAFGSDPSALDAVTGDGGLTESDAFQLAVPDYDDASAFGYVDVARAIDLASQGADGVGVRPEDLEPLQAVGYTATGGESGTFRLRITVR